MLFYGVDQLKRSFVPKRNVQLGQFAIASLLKLSTHFRHLSDLGA